MAEVSAATLHIYCQVEPKAHQPFLEPVFEKNQKCGTSQTPAIAGNMWHGWSLLRDEVENSETIAGLCFQTTYLWAGVGKPVSLVCTRSRRLRLMLRAMLHARAPGPRAIEKVADGQKSTQVMGCSNYHSTFTKFTWHRQYARDCFKT